MAASTFRFQDPNGNECWLSSTEPGQLNLAYRHFNVEGVQLAMGVQQFWLDEQRWPNAGEMEELRNVTASQRNGSH